jgi:hypothetical protein
LSYVKQKGPNAAGCRSFSMTQYDAAGRTARIFTQGTIFFHIHLCHHLGLIC